MGASNPYLHDRYKGRFDDGYEAYREWAQQTQYYEVFGSRGIWHQGWKAVTEHGPTSGMSNFDRDRWQLFHTDTDRSQAHDLAEEHPDRLEELKALWLEEAKANKRPSRPRAGTSRGSSSPRSGWVSTTSRSDP